MPALHRLTSIEWFTAVFNISNYTYSMGTLCSMHGMRNVYKILIGKSKGKKNHFGNLRVYRTMLLKSVQNKEMWRDADWIYVAQDNGHLVP
jgi:hypothetical protein